MNKIFKIFFIIFVTVFSFIGYGNSNEEKIKIKTRDEKKDWGRNQSRIPRPKKVGKLKKGKTTQWPTMRPRASEHKALNRLIRYSVNGKVRGFCRQANRSKGRFSLADMRESR